MVRWLLRAALAVVILGVVLFFTVLPGAFERASNPVIGGPWPVSPRAAALHRTLFVADLHADTLLWNRDVWKPGSRGHVDLPRLKQGNVGLQTFSSVTKSPWGLNYDSNPSDSDTIWLLALAQLQPTSTWTSLLQRSLWHAEKLNRAQARDPNLRIVKSVRDLDEALAARARGRPLQLTLLSVEGLHNLEGRFENLEKLRAAGFRMAGLAHLFDSEVAGSTAGERKYGLTAFGRRVVPAMEASGMIVDLAHVSHAGIAETLRIARKPVVQSHGGVQGTCANNRTLTDAEVLGIARTGGVVGIGLWDAAVCAATPRAAAKAMRYVRDLAGIRAVALGSDWDGAVGTPFDAAGTAALTQALMDEGFAPDEIRLAMGLNVVRVLRATLPPA